MRSHVQVRHFQRVGDDEVAPRLHHVAHQGGEHGFADLERRIGPVPTEGRFPAE